MKRTTLFLRKRRIGCCLMAGVILFGCLCHGRTTNADTTGALRKQFRDIPAGTVIDVSDLGKKQIHSLFYSRKIDDTVFRRMRGKSYKKNCTVDRNDLRYIRLLYVGYDHRTHVGELVVNRKIATEVTTIFYKLYRHGYELHSVKMIDDYGADDEKSMSADNTSSFNFRAVSGTTKLSKHSYGLAIDINPRYNPYIHKINGRSVCEPSNGKKYADRSRTFRHKIDHTDYCYKLFHKYGFTWGGDWRTVKDYQHFQKEI